MVSRFWYAAPALLFRCSTAIAAPAESRITTVTPRWKGDTLLGSYSGQSYTCNVGLSSNVPADGSYPPWNDETRAAYTAAAAKFYGAVSSGVSSAYSSFPMPGDMWMTVQAFVGEQQHDYSGDSDRSAMIFREIFLGIINALAEMENVVCFWCLFQEGPAPGIWGGTLQSAMVSDRWQSHSDDMVEPKAIDGDATVDEDDPAPGDEAGDENQPLILCDEPVGPQRGAASRAAARARTAASRARTGAAERTRNAFGRVRNVAGRLRGGPQSRHGTQLPDSPDD